MTWLRRRGRKGHEVGAVHTTNGIRDPPYRERERRKLPGMKIDCKGEVVMVALYKEG